jgi:hypothetical protein
LFIAPVCDVYLYRRPGKDYVSITEEMHESNLAVLRRNEFDIVVERFGIPVSQHDMLTLTDTNWLNDHIIGMQQHRFHSCVQGCGSGLDLDSIGSVDPDPGGQK